MEKTYFRVQVETDIHRPLEIVAFYRGKYQRQIATELLRDSVGAELEAILDNWNDALDTKTRESIEEILKKWKRRL